MHIESLQKRVQFQSIQMPPSLWVSTKSIEMFPKYVIQDMPLDWWRTSSRVGFISFRSGESLLGILFHLRVQIRISRASVL